MKFLLGKKIGMTRIFDDQGNAIPVTVIEVGPNLITQIISHGDKHKIQIGYGTTKHLSKPQKGHLTKSKIDESLKYFRETAVTESEIKDLKPSQKLDVSIFSIGDLVNVQAVSKGKGFSGVIKRHHFHRGPTTHGSDHHRAPGSIGSMYPQRVLKGRKMPGRLGGNQVTVKSLRVITIDAKENLLAVSGAIPGPKGSLMVIKGVS